MEKKVLNYIKENHMINSGDKILVALSGGPDSVCLINILNNLKKELNISIYAAHVNHCLRGKDADEDEKYVQEICRRLSIECYTKKVDVNYIAEQKGISSEMAGREVRYEFFNELKIKLSLNKIALAHNANDQAETILMRILRGTGSEGLIGIKPVRDNIYIRPILNLTREEIEKYCEENKLNPRIDKTNMEAVYTRNKIRLELLPYIKDNFNKDIIETLNRLSKLVEKDNDYIEKVVLEKYDVYCSRVSKDEFVINKEAFKEHEAILTRIIRKALNDFNGSLYNLEKIHIYDIINLQSQGTGKLLNLPKGVTIENQYGDIYLKTSNFITKDKKFIFHELPLKAYEEEILSKGIELYLQEFRANLYLKLIYDKKSMNLNSKDSVKYFDYDKIKDNIIIRNRKEGDRFKPLGMKGSKKIKDIFIDLKIPKSKRDLIPLLCFGDDISWIVGYKVSDLFKVDKDTKKLLEIKFESEVNL